MKSVLISIQPKWCELIASGKKTVEIRKTAPKEVPFKAYIYCTKARKPSDFMTKSEQFGYVNAPEYVFCNRDNRYDANGKVIGEFICDKVEDIYPEYGYLDACCEGGDYYILDKCCLSRKELIDYGKRSKKSYPMLYAWNISELKIYDKPRELREFFVIDKEAIKKCEFRSRVWQNPDFIEGGMILGGCVCDESEDWCTNCKIKPITRPPQSWCYVEEN